MSRKTYDVLFHLVATPLLLLAISSLSTSHANDKNVSASPERPHVFEQRIYTTADGLLPHLHARFRNHTNYLFVKHGMKLIGYWTPVDQPNTLIYILAYPSMEAREASWKAFMADPEWQRVWDESKKRAGGSIVTKVVSTFMAPTDYSPLR